MTQKEKGERFLALHQEPGVFVIPNPWDVGSAKILDGLGFKALATSSAASAMTLGQKDGTLSREQAIAHAASRFLTVAVDVQLAPELAFAI